MRPFSGLPRSEKPLQTSALPARCKPFVELHEISPQTMIVRLHGEHDLFTKKRLTTALAQACAAPHLIVDLTPCTFLESSIICALVGARDAREYGDATVGLVLPPRGGIARRALEMARVSEYLEVHETIADALARTGEPRLAESALS